MYLNQQQLDVLRELRFYPRDAFTLSYHTFYPEASVRRTIQELKQKGYLIASSRRFGYELLREKPVGGNRATR